MSDLLSFFMCSLHLYFTNVDLILPLAFTYKVDELLLNWIHAVHRIMLNLFLVDLGQVSS